MNPESSHEGEQTMPVELQCSWHQYLILNLLLNESYVDLCYDVDLSMSLQTLGNPNPCYWFYVLLNWLLSRNIITLIL